MTSDENPADVIEQAAEVAYKTGIYVNEYAAGQIARALHDAGLLADPADRYEHWLTKFREAQVELGQVKQVLREIDELRSRAEAERDHAQEVAELAEKDRRTYHRDALRAEAEVAELEHRLGDCTCGPWHPDMDGPAEECPRHGRCYSDWVDAVDAKEAQIAELRATVDRCKALADEWERALSDTLRVEIDELRAALDGSGQS